MWFLSGAINRTHLVCLPRGPNNHLPDHKLDPVFFQRIHDAVPLPSLLARLWLRMLSRLAMLEAGIPKDVRVEIFMRNENKVEHH